MSDSALSGNTVLVVGGTSGAGLATARAAAGMGARVHVAGRSQQRLTAALHDLSGATGTAVDAEDPDALAALLDRTAPDHIVLTTGDVLSGPIAEIEVAALLAYISSRLSPLFTTARWAAHRPGLVISITVVGGFVFRKPAIGHTAWAAVGPALVGVVQSLAIELAPTRVNEVAPGMIIDSPRARRYFTTDADLDAGRAELEVKAPTRRAVTVDDVARQVLGFVTDPVITGNVRTVDSGLSLL